MTGLLNRRLKMDDDKTQIEIGGGCVVYDLTDSQRDAVRQLIQTWRKNAEPIGPLHSLWDDIMDAESLLAGKPVNLVSDDLINIVTTSPDKQ